MLLTDRIAARLVVATLATILGASACSPSPTPSASAAAPIATASEAPVSSLYPEGPPASAGTIYLLHWYEEIGFLDPQRVYTFEDTAFLGATIQRSLVTYASSPDPIAGTTLVPDMATDLGRTTDGGRTWSFTLRDGLTWQDGSEVTCEDVKYGVSRTFANNVINQGPTYAIAHLDIPPNPVADDPEDPESAFLSAYYGPYDTTGQDLFDDAVECSPDHRTITFHLKQAVGDFNYTVTLGFGAVPKAADTGETYGQPGNLPWSNGPYMVESYSTGNGGRLILTRNPNWNRASDPIRKAYPDRWVVELGADEKTIDQRLIDSTGEDAFALSYPPMLPENLSTVFSAPDVAKPEFASRVVSGYDLYARYDWIDVTKVPNLKHRQAMLVALDRQAIRDVLGGPFAGSYADGVIQPTLGMDYAPTGIWDTFFGRAIPETGDPALAKQLIAASGEAPPTLRFRIADTPANKKILAVVTESLGRAGFTVEWDPPCEFSCAAVFDKTAAFGVAGWGADWPNASTVIPTLFTIKGGWDYSAVDDPAFNAAVDDAMATLDREAQSAKWRALNRHVVENGWVIPTFFTRTQRLAGTNVGPIYLWPAYASWPYREMYVTQ